MSRGIALFVGALVCLTRPAGAQWGVWQADSLLAEGRLASAESAYYAAARANPRDPIARAALGRYLAARGGVKAGAVLIEEARFFGGDSGALARVLVPLYARLADYRSLADLRPNVLSVAERQRTAWLSNRPSEARLRDSVVLLSYRPMGDGGGLGGVMLRVGGMAVEAVIDPRITGLVLPSTLRHRLRLFGREGSRTLAVVDTVRLGSVSFSNVPVSIGTPDEPARLGFDVIAPYFPGFDPSRRILTLRRVGRRSPSPTGSRIPALYDENGIRLLVGSKWQPTTASMPAMLLATRRWIWDWKFSDVVLVP